MNKTYTHIDPEPPPPPETTLIIDEINWVDDVMLSAVIDIALSQKPTKLQKSHQPTRPLFVKYKVK